MNTLPPREGYDLYAGEYRKDHAHLDSFDWETAGSLWKKACMTLWEVKSNPLALDAGCGDGRTMGRWSRWLKDRPPLRLWGLDISPAMVAQARKRVPGAHFSVVDLGSLAAVRSWTGENGRADLVSSFFVLVHFSLPADYFKAMAELCAPGGSLVMNTIPQKSPPVLQAGGRKFTIKAYDHGEAEVEKAALEGGFKKKEKAVLSEDGQWVSTVYLWQRTREN